jgi:hypothetical protein
MGDPPNILSSHKVLPPKGGAPKNSPHDPWDLVLVAREQAMRRGLGLEGDDAAGVAPLAQGGAVLAGIGADVDHAGDGEALQHRDELGLEGTGLGARREVVAEPAREALQGRHAASGRVKISTGRATPCRRW